MMTNARDVSLVTWEEWMKGIGTPKILFTGAKVWPHSVNHQHNVHAPHGKWIGTDCYPGDGVDIVTNLEGVDPALYDSFDGVFCPSTLEHVERPWLAVNEMAKMLRNDGALFLQTHQTFPLHYYSDDYYRFSTSALKSLCTFAGLLCKSVSYDQRCQIVPGKDVKPWNTAAESFLLVSCCAVKRAAL